MFTLYRKPTGYGVTASPWSQCEMLFILLHPDYSGIKKCRMRKRGRGRMWASKTSERSSCMRGHDTWNGLHAWLSFVVADNSSNQLRIAGSIPAQVRFHLYTTETQTSAQNDREERRNKHLTAIWGQDEQEAGCEGKKDRERERQKVICFISAVRSINL